MRQGGIQASRQWRAEQGQMDAGKPGGADGQDRAWGRGRLSSRHVPQAQPSPAQKKKKKKKHTHKKQAPTANPSCPSHAPHLLAAWLPTLALSLCLKHLGVSREPAPQVAPHPPPTRLTWCCSKAWIIWIISCTSLPPFPVALPPMALPVPSSPAAAQRPGSSPAPGARPQAPCPAPSPPHAARCCWPRWCSGSG